MNLAVSVAARSRHARRPLRRAGDLPAYSVLLPLLWVWNGVRLWHFVGENRSQLDFAIFYDTGRAFWAGTDLYRSSRFGPSAPLLNLNPPIAVTVFAPLAKLPEPVALALWLAVNTFGFVASLRVIYRELYREPPTLRTWVHWLLWGTLLMPVLHQLFTANLAWLLMLPATLAWRSARRGAHGRAGAWLGVCLMLKPLFLWFLPYWVMRRRWSSITAAVAVGTASVVVAWAVFGTPAYRAWIETGRFVHWFADSANASILCATVLAVPMQAVGVVWAAAFVTVGIRTLRCFQNGRADQDREWAIVWLASILVSPLGWLYYYNLAAAPLLAVLRRGRTPVVTAALVGLCVQEVPLMWLFRGHGAAIDTVAAIPFASTAAFWWVLTGSRVSITGPENKPVGDQELQ